MEAKRLLLDCEEAAEMEAMQESEAISPTVGALCSCNHKIFRGSSMGGMPLSYGLQRESWV